MVALLAIALIGMVGLALDVGRLMVAKAELRRAVDAAALAGALKLDDHPEIEASEYMAEHEPEADVEYPAPPGERQFEVIATKYVDLTFLKVLTLVPGLDLEDPVAVSANAVAGFGIQPVDTYLAIDATGSMGASPCTAYQTQSGCPIKESKDAAAGFVDVLLDDAVGSEYTQVGVGAFRGCYYQPKSVIEGGTGRQRCITVSQMVTDLDTDKSYLNTRIGGIWAIDHTAGTAPLQPSNGVGSNVCLGMYKGNEALFGPNGQTASNTLKIIVILSDGDNNYAGSLVYQGSPNYSPPVECRPSSNYTSSDTYLDSSCRSAQTRERSVDTKTKAFADTLKSSGVEIYVVGFGVCGTGSSQLPTTSYCSGIGNSDHDNTADRRLLKCTASSTTETNDHYFEVPNADDLPAVFDQIARNIAFRLIK